MQKRFVLSGAVALLAGSEEHLREWLVKNRAYKRLKHLSMEEFLAEAKSDSGD